MARANPPSSRNPKASGTITRLTTALSRDDPLNSNMPVKIEDTPITRGGLGAIQNSGELVGRQIHDRTYFIGIIRSKTSELESEIQRIQRDTGDNKQYIALRKISEDLSQQIEDFRNELEDYNMARMNSFTDVKELKKEIDDLHAHNQQLESNIEEIYLDKQRKEQQFQQLEHELNLNTENMNEISTLEHRMNQIREQTSNSSIKQEALSLIDQISELELIHDQLFISSTDGEQIDEFLLSYDQTREQYLNDINQIQKTNSSLLETITRTLIKDPFIDQYEIEKQKSNNTIIILYEQHRKLKQEYIKLETLDQRLKDELEELKIKYKKMKEELEIFNDLESLKRKAEKRKQQLTADKINMIKQKQTTQIEIQTLQSQFDAIHKQLHDNETYQQLISLDKKFQTISQTLFTLDESLISQNIQNQYEQTKRQALELVYAHNRWLIQQLK